MPLWIWFVIILAALAVLTLAAAAALFFSSVTRIRKPADYEAPGDLFYPYRAQMRAGETWFLSRSPEKVSIRSYDGLTLRGMLLPHPEARGTILLMNGYRGTGLHDFCAVLPYYYQLGFNLLLPDERACGESDGKYICFGVRERFDCRDWAAFANARFGSDLPLFLDGISMGAATVLMAAGLPLPGNVRGIIADCGFTSPRAIMAHVLRAYMHLPVFPLLPAAALFTKSVAGFGLTEADAREALKQSRLPVLFVHGENDTFVPPAMSRENYAACAGEKELYLVPGASHGESYLIDRAGCEERLAAFLEKYAA